MAGKGDHRRKVWLFVALAAFLVLWGCARAPRKPQVPPLPPPPPSPVTPQESALERAIAEFFGAPYRPGGISPGGVDCSGLVMAAFQRLGLFLPRTVIDQYNAGRPVPRSRLRFGDVVFFNRYCQISKSGPYLAGMLPSSYVSQICHNGIYLGNGRFIHASPRGVQISNLDEEVWRISFMGARRFFSGEAP